MWTEDFKEFPSVRSQRDFTSVRSFSLFLTALMSKQAPTPKNKPPPAPTPQEEEEDTEQLAWDECAKPMAKFVTRCLDASAKNPEKDEQCQKLYQETAYCFAPLLFPKEDQALANCWGQVEIFG